MLMNTKRSTDPAKVRIMVIDDEEVVLKSCRRILGRSGYQVETTTDPREGLQRVLDEFFNLVIVDLMMPDLDGMEVLKSVKAHRPETEVIMITGYSTVKNAVEAMKLGATDYVPKPFNPSELDMVVEKALEKQTLLAENEYLRGELQDKYRLGNLIGQSSIMTAVFRQILKVAPTSGTVLIYGESGTGKELVARAIHFNSHRKERPFIVADCSTLAPNLIESELFGHVKGSFTGADRSHKGLFELADGGTLFLDEIANISCEAQGKLLRVLESGEFRPVGGEEAMKVDIRLIVASNQDLNEMATRGEFREDLFYRLNVIPISIPPLRERREDIGILATCFLDEFRAFHGKDIKALEPGAIEQLMAYSWSGNVRELRNTMERFVIMADGPTITEDQVALTLGCKQGETTEVRDLQGLKKAKKMVREEAEGQVERAFILDALERSDWNVSQAARETGIQRTHLHALMKKHGIQSKRRTT